MEINFRIREIHSSDGSVKFRAEKFESKKNLYFGEPTPKWVSIYEPNIHYSYYVSYESALLAIDEYIRRLREPKEIIHDLPEFTITI